MTKIFISLGDDSASITDANIDPSTIRKLRCTIHSCTCLLQRLLECVSVITTIKDQAPLLATLRCCTI